MPVSYTHLGGIPLRVGLGRQGQQAHHAFHDVVDIGEVAAHLMICSGASELAMAQWASAYAEAALGLSKAAGDLAGPCMLSLIHIS